MIVYHVCMYILIYVGVIELVVTGQGILPSAAGHHGLPRVHIHQTIQHKYRCVHMLPPTASPLFM